jgi:hypothetical protein
MEEDAASVRKVADENLILKLAVADLRLDFTNLEEGAADECELLPERESGMLLTTFCDGIQEILERTWVFGEGREQSCTLKRDWAGKGDPFHLGRP